MTREEWTKLILDDQGEKIPLTPERFRQLLKEAQIEYEKQPTGPVNHWSAHCSKCTSGEHYMDVSEQEIREIQNLADFVERRNDDNKK